MLLLKTLLATAAAATALAIGVPASAQTVDHSNMPGMKMPPAKKPAAKKPAAKKPAAKKPTAKKPAAKKPTAKKASAKKSPAKSSAATKPSADPRAGHTMSAPGQTAPATTMPPGHDMSTMPGMAMPGVAAPAGTDLPAGNAPPPPVPIANAADQFYDPAAMEMSRHHLMEFHGGQKLLQVSFNIAEARFRRGRDGFGWEGDAWYGGDINRLLVKTEGEGDFGGEVEQAEVQALYSRAIDPYWNVQGGLRYDFRPNPSRVYATVALEGLAPSFFDVEGALFLSNKGELMARASGWYDQRITQRLILQPRAEINLAAQNSREIRVGAGISDAEVGLRLRYDIRREFSPYIGVQYSRAFGRTRRYLREEGEKPQDLSLLTGIRFWF